MSKATEEVLSALHGAVAHRLLSELQNEELQPAMMAQAVKFLKDNDISVSIEEDETISELDSLLKQKRQRRKLRLVGDE